MLRGEAGVGKSALLNEVIAAGRRADVRVLATAGVSLQMQQPFAGLSHLMRSVLNDPALPDRRTDAWDTVRAGTASPTPSAKRKRGSCMTASRYPPLELRCSRPPRPTSTR